MSVLCHCGHPQEGHRFGYAVRQCGECGCIDFREAGPRETVIVARNEEPYVEAACARCHHPWRSHDDYPDRTPPGTFCRALGCACFHPITVVRESVLDKKKLTSKVVVTEWDVASDTSCTTCRHRRSDHLPPSAEGGLIGRCEAVDGDTDCRCQEYRLSMTPEAVEDRYAEYEAEHLAGLLMSAKDQVEARGRDEEPDPQRSIRAVFESFLKGEILRLRRDAYERGGLDGQGTVSVHTVSPRLSPEVEQQALRQALEKL